ncbi:phosphotransferase [uncultured Maritimibacter sp.]|uniref:phosphotransferase n=1 Tax=uncultured Maritimibacter sp. TaxID=991866 RepID=UPI002608A56E|nr:phosphotransferase [uncultured Maritimibacter sp.]
MDLTPLFGPAGAPDSREIPFRVFPRRGPERWLLDRDQRRPWHLETWPRANLRARAIYRAATVMGFAGLHLPSRTDVFRVAASSVYGQLAERFDRLGVFLGTPGPNRKFVVYAARPGTSVFVKVPLGPVSRALVAREQAALAELARDPAFASLVPRTETIAGQLAIENMATDGTGHAALDLAEVARIHDMLYTRSAGTRRLSELRTGWSRLHTGDPVPHDPPTRSAIDKARTAAHRFLDTLPNDLRVPCYMAHGDFTRWNVLRARDGSARIIDWELYGLKPRWFDLIHYIASQDILVGRRPVGDMLANLETAAGTLGLVAAEHGWRRQVALYFCDQTLSYCGLYERQSDLHAQAFRQLETWTGILGRLTEAEGPRGGSA